jgi:spermidine synthase
VPDPGRPNGWALLVEDVAQSYVDLDDPTHLEFEYVRRVASVIDTCAPSGAPLRVLHLGGGALSIPRYIAATRPGSEQLVIERDAALALLVHRNLPLPPNSGIEVHIKDARTAIEEAPADAYDLIISDAYEGAAMPPELTSTEFAEHVAKTLRPTGTYLVNVTDLPVLAFTRKQAATLRGVFADVCVVAEPGMLRGRRFGNVVLAAAHQPDSLRLAAIALPRPGESAPGRVLHGTNLDLFIGGARPVTDVGAVLSDPINPSDYGI